MSEESNFVHLARCPATNNTITTTTTSTTTTTITTDTDTTTTTTTTTTYFDLTRITCLEDLKALQKLYLHDWPKHCVGYYCLDNFIRWLTLDPQVKHLHIFTLNNDWQSDGLFIILDRYQLFIGSLKSNDNQLLAKALSQLDWVGGFKVSSFLDFHREAIMQIVRDKSLDLEFDSLTHLYYMPKKEVDNLVVNCPKGFYMKSLSLNDATLVDDLWPNHHWGSLFFIKRLIAWNPNMGIYVEDTHELVAWCLRLQSGFLGALQVKDTHKRLGLGSLVTAATSKLIAALGHDVMALVGPCNVASCGMFEKLGFQVTDICHWLRTKPTTPGVLWPENE